MLNSFQTLLWTTKKFRDGCEMVVRCCCWYANNQKCKVPVTDPRDAFIAQELGTLRSDLQKRQPALSEQGSKAGVGYSSFSPWEV